MLLEENDADGDGKVSVGDILRLFAPESGDESNSGLGSEQTEQLIAEADRNKDGGLNLDELASLVAKVMEREGGAASLLARGAQPVRAEEGDKADDGGDSGDEAREEATMLLQERRRRGRQAELRGHPRALSYR